jgi:hypothetical protein
MVWTASYKTYTPPNYVSASRVLEIKLRSSDVEVPRTEAHASFSDYKIIIQTNMNLPLRGEREGVYNLLFYSSTFFNIAIKSAKPQKSMKNLYVLLRVSSKSTKRAPMRLLVLKN